MKFYRPGMLGLLMLIVPEVARAQAAGPLARLTDYSIEMPWYSIALFAVMSGGVAAVSYVLWYRFGLIGDLRAQRTPRNTELVAFGLALFVAAAVFTIVTHAGVLYLVVISIIAAVLAIIGSATLLGVAMIGVMLLIVFGRIYGIM